MSRKTIRRVGSVIVTGLAAAYLVWKIDVVKTGHLLASANLAYFFGAVAIMTVTLFPMAWRWQRLLHARGVDDRYWWLTRAYFVSYAAGQLLPTSVGGDAVRIFETSRRHPGQGSPVAGSVVLERALGGAATLMLAAIGFVLAVGRYNVGAYLWVELGFVIATILLAVGVFSKRARPYLAKTRPILAWLKLERPVRILYEGLHGYRTKVWLLVWVCLLTLGLQAFRVLAIWLTGKAVGVDLPPRPYYVMGPLLFLVMLVPFTINGLAVREAFFVSFLGNLGVPSNEAAATGFLFFIVTLAFSVPGVIILAWESFRQPARARVRPDHG
jgi:uncharacterized protein (TIRG00374 family)